MKQDLVEVDTMDGKEKTFGGVLNQISLETTASELFKLTSSS